MARRYNPDEHANPVAIWDRETAEPLRLATVAEERRHYQYATRDEDHLDGDEFGFPGRRVWLARLDPRTTILGWTPDGHPIYHGWKYRGWERRHGRDRQVAFTPLEALRYAHAAHVGGNPEAFLDGAWFDAPGKLVRVDYRQDLGVDPEPLLRAWRQLYWTTSGKPRAVRPQQPIADGRREAI